jgi:hypothetical protein
MGIWVGFHGGQVSTQVCRNRKEFESLVCKGLICEIAGRQVGNLSYYMENIMYHLLRLGKLLRRRLLAGIRFNRWLRAENLVMFSMLGTPFFPADNPWNQRIDQAPVAANSSAILGNIGNGSLHPDFGQDYHNSSDLYGIPYNIVRGNSATKVHVVIDAYPSESDIRDVPLPANVVLEGDFQNGARVGVDARGDSHLLVWDKDANVAYEFYRASRPSENSDGKWHADGEAVWDMKTNSFRTLGWTSADAAGLPILPGLVRPDEGLPVSQGGQGVINHAIRFTLQNSKILDQFIYPASHTANPGNTNTTTQPPMGTRFRLKASVDISQLNPQSKVIAQAMKDYGLIVADNGSNFYFSGASQSVDANNNAALTWSDNDIQDTLHGLKSLKFNQFEVVDLTPRITGLSAASGSAGAQVTITGQNFSGAAGHLQVLFGSTPGSSLTIVDDSHLTVVIPAGSGTVDIQVQSGLTVPNNADNIKGTIFGYGISAKTAADRFTFIPTAAWLGGSTSGATNWGLAANWNPGTQVPGGPGVKVTFGTQSAANNTVDMVSQGRTVGGIDFAATTGTTIKSSGNYNLILDNNGALSTINVAGSHTITAPVVLNNDATISGSGTLSLTGGISGDHALNVAGKLIASCIQVDTLTIGGASASAVPEPSALTLIFLGVCGAIAWQRWKSR